MGFVFYLIAMCALLTSPTIAGNTGLKLTPPPGVLGKGDHPQFGRALGLSSGVLAVGAPYAYQGKGAVLLYCGDFAKPRLVKIVQHEGDRLFGFALALAGNKLAVASKTRVYLYTWIGDCPHQVRF